MEQLPSFGDISAIRNESTLHNSEMSEEVSHSATSGGDNSDSVIIESRNSIENMESEEIQTVADSEPIIGETMSMSTDEDNDDDEESSAELAHVDNENYEKIDLNSEENGQSFGIGEEEPEEDEDDMPEEIDLADNGQDLEDEDANNEESTTANERLVRLPLSKIKKIMKTDDQVGLVNKDALIATTILTEHFISLVAQQSYKLAAASKKKTISLNHVKSALISSSMFDFLEGTLPQLDN